MIYTLTLNPAVDRELTVPAIIYDAVLRATDWRVDLGGKGFNVSRMLHALGEPSVALGFAGGHSGEMLRDGLEAMGIGTDFVWIDGETRTNVSIVTAEHDHYIKVNEPGPTIAHHAQAALLEKVHGLSRAGDWWVLAGSLPPGVEPGFYGWLIDMIQAAGAHAILDTSGAALEAAVAHRPFLVKPNEHEAAKLTGLPADTAGDRVALARAVQMLSPANVVISLGKDGALLWDGSAAWKAASPPVQERNPIGAGDSMVGGLVWALNQGLPLEEALGWGIACGAATASMDGTAVGPRPLVEQLFTQVNWQRVSDTS